MEEKTLRDSRNELLSYLNIVNIPKREEIVKNIIVRLNEGATISYSQNFEDIMLYRVFKSKDKGVYVDVGAYDPIEKSTTNIFYQRGWSGINIDLCEENIQKFNVSRPRDTNICAAIGSHNGLEEYYVQPGTTRSTKLKELGDSYARRGLDVRTKEQSVTTLTEILKQHGVKDIDFLSIDVEGAEKDVLSGLDFNYCMPTIIFAEATYPETNIPNWESWEGILKDVNYECVYFDGLNRFYIQKGHEHLKELFSLPPNYFDNFIKIEQIICALSE